MLTTHLWHASRADIDRPTLAGRTAGDHHANSGLGLFCATGPDDYIANFGGFVFALELASDLRVLEMKIADLANYPRRAPPGVEPDRAWFQSEGERLAKDYDVIALKESDGLVCQAIVLTDAAVVSAKKMTAAQFLSEHASPLAPKAHAAWLELTNAHTKLSPAPLAAAWEALWSTHPDAQWLSTATAPATGYTLLTALVFAHECQWGAQRRAAPDYLRRAARAGVDPNALDAMGRSSVLRGLAFLKPEEETTSLAWLLTHGLDVFHATSGVTGGSLLSHSQCLETAQVVQEHAQRRLEAMEAPERAAVIKRLRTHRIDPDLKAWFDAHRRWLTLQNLDNPAPVSPRPRM